VIYLILKEALSSLYTAKLRSILAILGVLVGTAAIVALIASSRLATNHALSQFKTLGTHLLALNFQSLTAADASNAPHSLSLTSINQLEQSSSQVAAAAPYIQLFQPMVIYGKSFSGQIVGTTENFMQIAKVQIEQGRFVLAVDSRSFYCVIGAKIAEQFERHHHHPIGQQLQVGQHFFTIVGVAQRWQPNLFLLLDLNRAIIVPIATTRLLSAEANIQNILFRLTSHPNLPLIRQALSEKMAQLLPNTQLQFRDPGQIIHLVGQQRQTFNWLLIATGGISLVVGGIGVMNIMLVSVVERRREIGMRMAIGAKRFDIACLFLVEAVMLTLFGGIMGVILGLLVTYAIAVVTAWEFYFYWIPVLLGFLVSVFVGMLSGFYPAWRAAQLDPIQCLTL